MSDQGLAAQQVWDVWRHLLADDPWRQALVSGDAEALTKGRTEGERAVAQAYASTPEATGITIGMFRRRCCTVARSSLSLVAPFSRRLLELAGDARRDEITLGYTRASGYADDGPNFCRTALRFIEYLRTHSEFCERPGWLDVLAIDEASLKLQMRLGQHDGWQADCNSDSAFDPDKGESYDELDGWFAQRCPLFELAQTEHDITPWLQAPTTDLGRTALERRRSHWAVSLPNDEDPIEYSGLTEDAVHALAALAVPRSARALGLSLGPRGLGEDEVLCVLGDLFEERLIRFIRGT